MKNTKMLVLVMMIIAAVAGVIRFWDIVLMVFAAAVLAYLLGPLVRLLARKMPRGLAVGIVVGLALLVIILLLSMSVPFIINQITGLVHDLNATGNTLEVLVGKAMDYLTGLGLPQAALNQVSGLIANLDTYLMSLLTAILQGLVNVSLGILDLVVMVILIIYFMLDGSKIKAAVLGILPEKPRQSAETVMAASNALTKRYIRTRVLLSGGMACVIYLGFSVIGIRYALLFALMSFVFDFVPYFGSIAAGVIEAVYALVAHGPATAAIVLVFVLVVQQLEGNVIAPKVEGEATGIHPIVVIAALLMCNQLFGPIGMLISTPLAAISKIILKEAYAYVTSPDEAEADGQYSIAPCSRNGTMLY